MSRQCKWKGKVLWKEPATATLVAMVTDTFTLGHGFLGLAFLLALTAAVGAHLRWRRWGRSHLLIKPRTGWRWHLRLAARRSLVVLAYAAVLAAVLAWGTGCAHTPQEATYDRHGLPTTTAPATAALFP